MHTTIIMPDSDHWCKLVRHHDQLGEPEFLLTFRDIHGPVAHPGGEQCHEVPGRAGRNDVDRDPNVRDNLGQAGFVCPTEPLFHVPDDRRVRPTGLRFQVHSKIVVVTHSLALWLMICLSGVFS